MEVSAFIDWLSITHFGSATAPMHEALPNAQSAGKPKNGYTRAIKYKSGIIEMYNPDRKSMGVHIIYSGKVLQRIQERYGVSRDEIVRFHTSLSGRIARIDFAVDIHDGSLNLSTLWDKLETGEAKTLSAHSRTQSGKGKGDTVYVGSLKTRKKLLRIYDKAKERGDFLSDYIRVELEARGNVAVNAVRSYQDSGYLQSHIMGMVRKFCDFPSVPEWENVFSHPAMKIPVGTHQTGNTAKWLIQQCAPALARVMIEDGEFVEAFLKEVKFHVEKLKAEEGA